MLLVSFSKKLVTESLIIFSKFQAVAIKGPLGFYHESRPQVIECKLKNPDRCGSLAVSSKYRNNTSARFLN